MVISKIISNFANENNNKLYKTASTCLSYLTAESARLLLMRDWQRIARPSHVRGTYDGDSSPFPPFQAVCIPLVPLTLLGNIIIIILWSGVMVACQAHNLETRYRVRIPPPLEHRDRNFHVVMLGSR